MKGVVLEIGPELIDGRLRVTARVRTEEQGEVQAYLPDREVSAFLPRALLVGPASKAPRSLLGTLRPILQRFAVGRQVRVWEYQEGRYFCFPSWRSVRFLDSASDERAISA